VIIACPNCGRSLPPEVINAAELRFCPACNSNLLVRVFPANSRAKAVIAPAALALAEGDASCFHHATKRAVSSCSQCGRFLCALCEVDLSGQILCPSCLESGGAKKKIRNLENHRTLWDTTALLLGASPLLLPFPMLYFIFLTGPIAIFLSIRHWKSPSSLIPRTKWRFIVAIVLGLLQVGAVAAIVALLCYSSRAYRPRFEQSKTIPRGPVRKR
jgi:DNA-directed RNA polymerase subunit RPC12/RpoP